MLKSKKKKVNSLRSTKENRVVHPFGLNKPENLSENISQKSNNNNISTINIGSNPLLKTAKKISNKEDGKYLILTYSK